MDGSIIGSAGGVQNALPLLQQKSLLEAAAKRLAPSGETKQTGGNNDITRAFNDNLDRDAFLQLLVLQLQNQDPLSPQSNEDMLAQLAQFSALEQMNNLNDSFGGLSSNIDQLNFLSASNMIGREVSGVDANGERREGVVESVALNGSVVVLMVDGEPMSMAGVLEIR